MKKIFSLIAIALASVSAIQAQSVKIMKDGVVIASYDATQFDQVVFSGEAEQASAAGTYNSCRTVSVGSFGIVMTDATDIKITATESAYSIALPECFYAAMNEYLPAVEISNVTINEADGQYTINTTFTGTSADGKAYSGTFSGWIKSETDFELTESMKYGSMPFALNMVYTPYSACTSLPIAGAYDAHLQVTLVEMPQMGTVVDQATSFNLSAVNATDINISLPTCTYNSMDLPAVTVKGVKVSKTDNAYTFSAEFLGTEESTNKTYSGTVSGSFDAEGNFTLTETMKYGSMPFTLNMVYTTLVTE